MPNIEKPEGRLADGSELVSLEPGKPKEVEFADGSRLFMVGGSSYMLTPIHDGAHIVVAEAKWYLWCRKCDSKQCEALYPPDYWCWDCMQHRRSRAAADAARRRRKANAK